jgi:ADP-heptose:LPS heptosyltransferase
MKPIKINPLAKKVIRWTSRRFFKAEAFSFAWKLKESQKVLICMPASIERFNMAKDSLSTLAEIFEGKTIFVLLPFLRTDGYLPSPAGYNVIYPQKEDLKIFSIPKRSFIQRVKEHQFDISLDLDLEDLSFNSYLCLECKIPLRLGAQGKRAFPFYNVQLAVTKDKPYSPDIYEGYANVLRTLVGESETPASNRK